MIASGRDAACALPYARGQTARIQRPFSGARPGRPQTCACSVRRGGRAPRAFPTCGVNPRASCCEEMGAAVVRAIRNFNLENRAEREISKMKPSPAPRHPSTKSLLREQMSSKWVPGRGGPARGLRVRAGGRCCAGGRRSSGRGPESRQGSVSRAREGGASGR